MNYLLYQAYGSEDILNECIYSLLSFFRLHGEDFDVTIYTDRPEYFQKIFKEKYPISFEFLSNEKIKKWRGETQFVHRLKIEMLIDFFKKHRGNLLYVDTDTFFLKNCEDIFKGIRDGELFMHECEGVISHRINPIFKKVYKFLKKNQFEVDSKMVKVPLDVEMWNAGVLGFNEDHKPMLEQVLTLTDQMHAVYQKHVMEQLAFSYIFQINKPIQVAKEYIFHYWYFKGFREYLKDFFEKYQGESASDLMDKIEDIAPYKYKPHHVPKESFYKRLFKIFR